MRNVVVDSGAWIALANRDDADHESARAHYARLSADRAELVTTNYIVDETATRLRYDLGPRYALTFRDGLRDAERSGRLRVVWVDRSIESRAWEILERHGDVRLSLTDAVTIAVARNRRIREVFGFDDDFRAVGLRVAPD